MSNPRLSFLFLLFKTIFSLKKFLFESKRIPESYPGEERLENFMVPILILFSVLDLSWMTLTL